MGLGWVGSIRSSLRFICKIINTLQASPLRICEILFHKSPFELILHSIIQTFQDLVPRPLRPRLKPISIVFEKSMLEFLLTGEII